MFDFKKDVEKLMEEEGVEYIHLECENKKDYYALLEKLSEFTESNIKVYGTSRNIYEYNMEKSDDNDEESSTTETEGTITEE